MPWQARPETLLAFFLAMAGLGLVLTALTHAELRRRERTEPKAGTEPKWFNVPTGLHLFIWMLVAAIVVLTFIGIVGWAFDFFRGEWP
jgi:predicted small integral membrane protein